jgi:hypothetical protein
MQSLKNVRRPRRRDKRATLRKEKEEIDQNEIHIVRSGHEHHENLYLSLSASAKREMRRKKGAGRNIRVNI